MKKIKQFYIAFTTIALLFLVTSCSNESDSFINEQSLSSTMLSSRTLPPPTPGELRGLYDVKYDTGIDAGLDFNLLFEYPNTLFYGSSTVHDMVHLPNMRANFSLVAPDTYTFSVDNGITTYNYRFTYDSSTTKIKGTYGTGSSYTNLGKYRGVKHITGSSGQAFVKGYWLGYYDVISDYVMVFEEDGKLTVGNGFSLFGSSIATGTYQIFDDGTVKGTYMYDSGLQFSFKGSCNYSNNIINGTWGYEYSDSNGGSFTVSAQNFY